MRKLSIIAILTSAVTLSACGQSDYYKEVGVNPDPGRVVKVENTELVKIQLGNTTIYYIGDKATKTCVAQTERVSSWWGSPAVSITNMPPEACGFPPKEPKVEVNVTVPPNPAKAPPTLALAPKKVVPPASIACPVFKTPGQTEGQPSGTSAMLVPCFYIMV